MLPCIAILRGEIADLLFFGGIYKHEILIVFTILLLAQ